MIIFAWYKTRHFTLSSRFTMINDILLLNLRGGTFMKDLNAIDILIEEARIKAKLENLRRKKKASEDEDELLQLLDRICNPNNTER